MLDPLRNDGKKNLDLAPPPRAKFLHFRPSRSPAMQEHMAEVVYPTAEVVKPTLNPNLSQGELEKSQSQGDFAWGSDRIAHELAHKLDQFTRRPEDGVRKLLWTVGTDHGYESKSRNSISVTPKNLTGLCNRFGLACNDGQAHRRRLLHAHTPPTHLPCCPHLCRTHVICHLRLLVQPFYSARLSPCTPFPLTPHPTPRRQAQQIFERHRLPRDGCNVHMLSTHLLNPHVDTVQLARAEGRRALGNPYASSTRFSFAQGPRTPRMSKVQLAPAPAAPPILQWPVCSPRPSLSVCFVTGRTRSRWPSYRAPCPAGSRKAQARLHSHEARARHHSTADPRRVLGARLRCARRVGGERNRCAPSGQFSQPALGARGRHFKY